MIKRDAALSALAPHRGGAIVVAAYQACFDWLVIDPHPLNFVAVGAMGQASSHALGLALGRPDKSVMVFDGDGSLLMNLGTLVTIAEARPANLIHFVFENGTYEANGGHPTPGSGRISFAGVARAAGYASVFEHDDLDRFTRDLPALLAAPRPAFVTLKITAGAPSPQDYAYIHSAGARESFIRALAEG